MTDKEMIDIIIQRLTDMVNNNIDLSKDNPEGWVELINTARNILRKAFFIMPNK